MNCALNGNLRASPSGPPVQAPCGVGCLQRPSHEHERPASRLRVQPFPTITIPAGTTASADFSTASDALTDIAVPHHPANQKDGASGTPVETSPNKTNGLHRAPIASTPRPLDGHRASPCDAGSPGPPRLIRAAHRRHNGQPMRHVFLGSRFSPPASFPPRLAATQLPLTCGWCHQPPQGTRTPESLVMSGVHRVGAGLTPAPPTPPDVRVRIRRFARHPESDGRDRRIPSDPGWPSRRWAARG